MKKTIIIRFLILLIPFIIITLSFNPSIINLGKSKTIILEAKPIEISSIDKSSSYTEIKDINSFNVDISYDRISWLNDEKFLLSQSLPEFIINPNMVTFDLNTKTFGSFNLEASTSNFLMSPLGNKFLYTNIIRNPDELLKKYPYMSKYTFDYLSLHYYSVEDEESKDLPKGLTLIEWFPDGSGLIGRMADTQSMVTYNFKDAKTTPFIINNPKININQIVYIKISKDASTYFFSYLDYRTGLYSIYKMSKSDMIPTAIATDMSISGQFDVLNDNHIVISNPAKTSIYIYDTENHKIYKTLTTSSAQYYISRDKSMLVFVDYSDSYQRLTVINLNDPNFTPTEIFKNANVIDDIIWSNDNKLAFHVLDYYNSNSIVYIYSFK